MESAASGDDMDGLQPDTPDMADYLCEFVPLHVF